MTFFHSRNNCARFASLFATSVLVFTTAQGAGVAFAVGTSAPETPAPSTQPAGTQTAHVLYFQDAHEFAPVTWDDGSENGGIAYLSTVLRNAQSAQPDAITAFGGEVAGGTLFGAVYKGEPFVDAFNDLGVDVAGFGQHDFDQGSEWTTQLIDQAEYPWISSNLTHLDGTAFSEDGTTYVQESGGLKVGFLSLTSEMETTAGGASVVQRDLVESARQAAQSLKEQGVDVTVAITQISPDQATDVLTAVPDIDVAFTEENGRQITEQATSDGRLVISGQPDFASVIDASLTVDGAGQVSVTYDALPVNPQVEADPEYAQIAADYDQRTRDQLAQQVGSATEGLDQEELGFQVAQAYREYYGTDFGWQNAGGIRTDISEGDVTRQDVMSVLPFGNVVIAIEVTGAQLKDALEAAVESDLTTVGRGYPRPSGFTFDVDLEAPMGQRVSNLRTSSGDPITDDATYTLSVTKYVVGGGDGVTAFQNAPVVDDAEVTDAHVFQTFIEKHASIPVAADAVDEPSTVPSAVPSTVPSATTSAPVPTDMPTDGQSASDGQGAGTQGEEASAGGALPRTGAQVGVALAVGLALVVAGLGVIRFSRRRS